MNNATDHSSDRDGALPSLRALAIIFGLPLLALVGAVYLSATTPLGLAEIARDPLAVADAHPLTGSLSTVGVLAWWLAGGVCLFAFAAARSLGAHSDVARFLLSSGLFTLLLVIDDQFQIHDDLAGRYLGARERYVILAYGALLVLYLFVNRRAIRDSEWPLIGAALLLFAGSIGLDFVAQMGMEDVSAMSAETQALLIAEDTLKLFGIAAWAAYLIRYSYFALTRTRSVTAPPTVA